jgi:hypothetical protein
VQSVSVLMLCRQQDRMSNTKLKKFSRLKLEKKELVRDLEKVRQEKHAEAQRLYNKAQRLLGGATNFPPLMFPAFSEISGQESRFTVWRDTVRRELE